MNPKKETRQYSDRRDYLIKAVQKRRKKIREMAVEYKGGCCSRCGYSNCIEALEFHHLDPSKRILGFPAEGIVEVGKK